MKKGSLILVAILAVIVVAVGFYMVDVDVTDEGSLPDVDVSAEGGEMPEVDADVGSVEFGSETEQVQVPDVDVSVDSETVDVERPTVDVEPPSE